MSVSAVSNYVSAFSLAPPPPRVQNQPNSTSFSDQLNAVRSNANSQSQDQSDAQSVQQASTIQQNNVAATSANYAGVGSLVNIYA